MNNLHGSFWSVKKLLTILPLILIVPIVSGCAKSGSTTPISNTPTKMVANIENPEGSIKAVVQDYYTLLGKKQFGQAYQYVSSASNVSQKDYVDAISQKGLLVTGLSNISYNYVTPQNDTASVSATIVWTIIGSQVLNAPTTSQVVTVNLVKESGSWKILWSKDDNTSSTNSNQ